MEKIQRYSRDEILPFLLQDKINNYVGDLIKYCTSGDVDILESKIAKLETENNKMSERINIINFESEEVRYKLETENERLKTELDKYKDAVLQVEKNMKLANKILNLRKEALEE